jgi:MacB-like periplasmic core domain
MPEWKPHIRPRLASLPLSPARGAEIAEELAQHLEDRWRELVAGGAMPEEAAHMARTEFNGARLEALLGTLRQAHWHETPPPGPARAFSFDSVLIDLHHAIRALMATPSFTLGALLVLALGTGATTEIFSIVDAVALRPLPFPDPGRIVAVGVRADPVVGGGGEPRRSGPAPLGREGAMPGAKPPEPDALASITTQDYLDWANQQQVFEGMAALSGIGDYVFQPPGGEPELVKGDRVTAGFFDALRVRPMLGAVFTSQNEAVGGDRGVVVSRLGIEPRTRRLRVCCSAN